MNKNILNLNISSLRGRESNCASATSYSCERGVGKDADRATGCAMTGAGKVNANNLQPNQPSCLAALSPAASPDTNNSPLTIHHSLKQKSAFTLAEVLITLGIIGVVAATTMPILVENVSEYVNSCRQANIVNKITKAMEEMRALGLLAEPYSSTDAFVDELQHYLKIAKRCNADNIDNCWPKSIVISGDGKDFKVALAKKGKNIGLKSNTSDNVGLILNDGASVILTYNQNFKGIDVDDAVVASSKVLPVGFGKSKDFAYTTSVTSPIDFVMDVNGSKGPNSETVNNKYHDIRSFKVATFAGCAGVKLTGVGCV